MPHIPSRALRGLAAPERSAAHDETREPRNNGRDPLEHLPARTRARNVYDRHSRPAGESDLGPTGRYGESAYDRMAEAQQIANTLAHGSVTITNIRCEGCGTIRPWSGDKDRQPPPTVPECRSCSHYLDRGGRA